MNALRRGRGGLAAVSRVLAAVEGHGLRLALTGGTAPMRALFLALLAGVALRGEPVPVIFQSAPGHFEIAALDVGAAKRVATAAEECWQTLAEPLALPESFSTPVFVRLVPAAEWREPAAFHVIVEAGGVVSVRVRWDDGPAPMLPRRALVQGLLLRLAVMHHGVGGRPAAPLWLELGCTEWWLTRADLAHLDALKRASGRLAPPALADLLSAMRGNAESETLVAGAFWWLVWLQAESGRAAEWPAALRRTLGGEGAGEVLATCFPGRFGDEAERELWWQVGWHHVQRVRTLPSLAADESRRAVADAARFVFSGADGSDRVAPLAVVLGHAGELSVAKELQRHAIELARVLPALHPFYRNAGLSLTEVLMRRASPAAFESDWRDGMEVEAETRAALDALEAKPKI